MKFYKPDSRKVTSFYWCIHEDSLYAAYTDHRDDEFTPQNTTSPVDIRSKTLAIPELYLTLLGRDTRLYEP